jgi:NADH-quinone oxidoreductase subunit E
MTFSPQLEAKLEALIQHYPQARKRAALIPMLLFAQDEVGAITDELVSEIARRLEITPLQVDEVVTYYSMLRRQAGGKHRIQICTNVSCMLVGGMELLEHTEQKLGIRRGQTTADGQFSLDEVECMGACSWAPALQVNYDFHHFVTPERLDALIETLRKVQ